MNAIQTAKGRVATPDINLDLGQGILGRIAEWRRRRAVRKSYGQMTDAQLFDIGLTAHDIRQALGLPWNRNAARDIARAAGAEASRW